MNKLYNTKSVLVSDTGSLVEIAVRLSKDFGKTFFYSPWKEDFPLSNNTLIGSGIPGIERVINFFDVLEDVDLFVFPGVYEGDLQLHLEGLGKRVWGSRKGEEIELYRDACKKHLKSLGLPVGKYEVIKGMDALRGYLKENKNQFVKVSLTRGDAESFGAKDYKLVEPLLDEIEHTLGAKKNIMEFVVEEAIEDVVETGYDGYCVDGQFPKASVAGIEIKDHAYAGVFKEYKDLPKEITGFNDTISDTLKNYRYRGFLSTEIRVGKDHVPYMIDFCARAGSPPNELYQNMFKNLSDIIWNGSEGKMVDPICDESHGVEVIMRSTFAQKNWQPIQFPEEIRDNIKIRNLAIVNGEYYSIPKGIMEVGAVVATGKTREEAIEKAKVYCDQIEGHALEFHADSLDEADEEMQKLNDMGIKL